MLLRGKRIEILWEKIFESLSSLIDMETDALQDEHFTQFYDDPDTKFDLVIVGHSFNSLQFGIGEKFNAFLVLSCSMNNYVKNPNENAYVPNVNMAVEHELSRTAAKFLKSITVKCIQRAYRISHDARLHVNALHDIRMLAIPAFGDQPANAPKVMISGYGRALELFNLTDEQLRNAINEVSINLSYGENVHNMPGVRRSR
uniref:Uncharacterized protein n=1 Tax=Glossina austeni TaxID=7395 RepID=A0A1A9VTM1_GLOAU